MKKCEGWQWGILGMILIQSSWIPQWLHLWSTGNTEGISVLFVLMVTVGLVCFQVYSIKQKDWVFIVSNAFGLLNCLLVLAGIAWFRVWA